MHSKGLCPSMEALPGVCGNDLHAGPIYCENAFKQLGLGAPAVTRLLEGTKAGLMLSLIVGLQKVLGKSVFPAVVDGSASPSRSGSRWRERRINDVIRFQNKAAV